MSLNAEDNDQEMDEKNVLDAEGDIKMEGNDMFTPGKRKRNPYDGVAHIHKKAKLRRHIVFH